MNSEFNIAIHALVYLSRTEGVVSSETLSKSVCTNPARVRKVMSRLKLYGLVGAREGAVGGYYMVRAPKTLTLEMLLDALNLRLISSKTRLGDLDIICTVASGMDRFMAELADLLNGACREKLAQISIADLSERIFDKETLSQKAE